MSSSKSSILIVDDDGAIRSLLALSFETAGYDVQTAGDCSEAMQLCGSQSFDAVLSDVRMPGQSGHDLARWLANFHPATRSILMTGLDTGCEECPIAGRCRIVAKPFLPREIVSLVDRTLASPRVETALRLPVAPGSPGA